MKKVNYFNSQLMEKNKEKNDDILNTLNQIFNQDGVEDRQKGIKRH